MSPEMFAAWLQGALELFPEAADTGLTAKQVRIIQDHLSLVFVKTTPDRSLEFSGSLVELADSLPTPSAADSLESGIWAARTSGTSSNGGFSSPQAPEWGNWGDDLTAVCGGRYC